MILAFIELLQYQKNFVQKIEDRQEKKKNGENQNNSSTNQLAKEIEEINKEYFEKKERKKNGEIT